MEDQIKERSYKEGQLDLINKIKQDVLKLEANVPDGFDLALDILFLLKNIKPIEDEQRTLI